MGRNYKTKTLDEQFSYAIGDRVNKYIEDLKRKENISMYDLAQKVCDAMGLSPNSAYKFISTVRNGGLIDIIGSNAEGQMAKHFNKLSYLFQQINVPENDALVSQLREEYKFFKYPPKKPMAIATEVLYRRLKQKDQLKVRKIIEDIHMSYDTASEYTKSEVNDTVIGTSDDRFY